MATAVFRYLGEPGANIYYRVFNAAGAVFDFTDEDFTTLEGATKAHEDDVDELTDEGGSSNSVYAVTIDLAKLNATLVPQEFIIYAYSGAAPDDGDDPLTSGYEFTVQAGKLGNRLIEPELSAAFTTTEGDEVRLSAYLKVDGERYSLSEADSCVITVREHGEGVELYDVSGTANAQGRFELSKEDPGYSADRLYHHSVAITADGLTFTKDFDVPNYA